MTINPLNHACMKYDPSREEKKRKLKLCKFGRNFIMKVHKLSEYWFDFCGVEE
jgi:hypothetical protein